MRGFSLLEIIIVLVIAGAAYAILLSGPLKTSAADLKSAARSLAAGLRHTQSMAMATRRDSALTLDVEAREFRLPGESRPRKLPDGIDLKLFTAQSEVANEKLGSIRFYPDGSSTGGRITVSRGDAKYLVDVEWLTGRVTIAD
jgi:general secretion pathway protein H